MHLVPTYSVLIDWESVGDEENGRGGGGSGGRREALASVETDGRWGGSG